MALISDTVGLCPVRIRSIRYKFQQRLAACYYGMFSPLT